MRGLPTLAAALLTACLAVGARAATDPDAIDFKPVAAGSRQMEILKAKFPGVDFADAKVTAAVVVLGTSNVASLAARFVSPSNCVRGDVDGACRTVVLVAGTNDWDVVLDRRSKTIEFGRVGFGAMKDIVLGNGHETWSWNGVRYAVDVDKLGAAASLVPAPTGARTLLLQQFGPAVERLGAAHPKDVKVLIANVALHAGTKQILAHVEGPGLCGVVLGCPWRVLENKGKKYETVLVGYGTGKVASLPILRDGWHDVAISTPRGFVVYGWGGKSYAIADRSFERGSQ